MRVLVSAYACHPSASSERGVGWTWARAAARENDTWLLTREKNRDAIERAIRSEGLPKLHPVYIDLPKWARWWKRGERGMYLYYLLWQALAWNRARRLHADIKFDVAHHLTFALDWLPAGVCFVRGLRSVWGPVGGAQRPPVRLWPRLGLVGATKVALRWLVTGVGRRLFGTLTAHHSDLVVALNDEVAAFFGNFSPIVEQNAVVPDVSAGDESVDPRTALFVGRLIPLKGVQLALEALSREELSGWTLEVVGDGPYRSALEEQARRLGISERVHFAGEVPRQDVIAGMAKAQVFVFPSFHDSAGWAVAEAISAGCPVVCLDIGGPATMVRLAHGVRVTPGPDVVAELARAMNRTSERHQPTDRWTERRLPKLLSVWYREAATDRSGADGSTCMLDGDEVDT